MMLRSIIQNTSLSIGGIRIALHNSRVLIGGRRSISSSNRVCGIFDFITGKHKQEAPTPVIDETGKLIEQSSDDTYSELADLPANLPIVTSRKITAVTSSMDLRSPRQAWLDTLKCREDVKLGLVDLHPEVFAANPRIDLIHKNMRWQARYRVVDWRSTTTRSELTYRSTKKPWQQKGLGKARHGTRRSPLFLGGGQSKGPRGPQSLYYLLPQHVRVAGLVSALTIKLAQGQLHVVDGLEMPPGAVVGQDGVGEEEQGEGLSRYLEELVEQRGWGPAVLFVNHEDHVPRNIAMATANADHLNLMPYYGLNVWSMVKHDSVVLTLPALELIESRLLRQLKLCRPNQLRSAEWNEPIGRHFTAGHAAETELSLKYQ